MPVGRGMVSQILSESPNIKLLSLNRTHLNDKDAKAAFGNSTIAKLEVHQPDGEQCVYFRTGLTNVSCLCASGHNVILTEGGYCLCKSCTDIANGITYSESNITVANDTQRNQSNASITKHEDLRPVKYHKSITYSIILGVFSLVALVVNFTILGKMCSCDGQSVSKIFGMSLMLFNVLLAEYGIALAIYLVRDDGVWSKSFCQGMTAVKLFSMCAVIFSLLCLTFQWSINPPDDEYNSQNVRFKAIVYILEGSVLAAMVCILSWTKFDDWGYLCQIWTPRTTAEKIIVSSEYCYHATLFLLVLRYPYKTLRRKEPPPKYIKMKDVVEREHPIFIMVLFTFLFWSLPYIVTVPQFNTCGYHLTPLVRNCALMFGAVILPVLFVIRNSPICCSKHKACGVNDPHVCQCKGRSSNMCYACELQHQDMISNCDKYSLGDRRKSLSLDDLKYVLNVYKKENRCSLKIQTRKLISRSFPIINMDTIEETELEDLSDIERLFPGARKGKGFEISIEAAKQKKPLARDDSLSLPLLSSPRKCPPMSRKIPLHAKLSHSPCKTSLATPVKKSLEKKRAASFDTSKMGRKQRSPSSGRSSASSPCKSDDESKTLIKGAKKKDITMSKSKESAKSKDSIKSKDSGKAKLSKEKLQTEAVSSSEMVGPNRVSRIPSFIPLSDAESSAKASSKPTSPTAKSKRKSKEIKRQDSIENDGEVDALLEEDPNRVPSRGPTFFFVGEHEDDDASKDDVTKPLVGKEKKKKEKTSKRKSRKKKAEPPSVESTPAHKTAPLGSLHSLEWDPSFSLSDSSCSSPIDEYVPPLPAPPPSSFALQKVKEMEAAAPDSPQASIGRNSNFSMDWDPTSVQMRHSLVSPCEWEPYAVEEAVSNPTSPDIADLEKFRTSVVNKARGLLSVSPDKPLAGKAPLASEEI